MSVSGVAFAEAVAIDFPGGAASAQRSAGTMSLASMDAFLASHEKRAWSIARSSTHSDDVAFDIVQDVMLRMFENYCDKPASEWQRLFYRVLNNRITDHHRRRGWQRMQRWFGDERPGGDQASTDAVDQLSHDAPHPDAELDRSSTGQALRQALDTLPLRQRQAFLYRQWLGMSVAETAFAMQVSEGSVKTHLSRAMAAMRNELETLKP